MRGSPWRYLLVALFAVLLQACDTDLYTNLSEREANSMLATLLREGIPAERKVRDGQSLRRLGGVSETGSPFQW